MSTHIRSSFLITLKTLVYWTYECNQNHLHELVSGNEITPCIKLLNTCGLNIY